MKTLNQFKQEERVQTIDLLQKKGRAFASVNDKSLVVSKECDMKKPLYVIPLTNKEGVITPNAFLLINADMKAIASV